MIRKQLETLPNQTLREIYNKETSYFFLSIILFAENTFPIDNILIIFAGTFIFCNLAHFLVADFKVTLYNNAYRI